MRCIISIAGKGAMPMMQLMTNQVRKVDMSNVAHKANSMRSTCLAHMA